MLQRIVLVLFLSGIGNCLQGAAAAGAGAGAQKHRAYEVELSQRPPTPKRGGLVKAQVASQGVAKKDDKVQPQIQEPLAGIPVQQQGTAGQAVQKTKDKKMARIVDIVHANSVDVLGRDGYGAFLGDHYIDYIAKNINEFIKAVGALPENKIEVLNARVKDRIRILKTNELRDAVMSNAPEQRLKELIDQGGNPFEGINREPDNRVYYRDVIHMLPPFEAAFWLKNSVALRLFKDLFPSKVGMAVVSLVFRYCDEKEKPFLKIAVLSNLKWLFNGVYDPNMVCVFDSGDVPILADFGRKHIPEAVDVVLRAGADPYQEFRRPVYEGYAVKEYITTTFVEQLPNYSPEVQKVWEDYQPLFRAQQKQEIHEALGPQKRDDKVVAPPLIPVKQVRDLIGDYL